MKAGQFIAPCALWLLLASSVSAEQSFLASDYQGIAWGLEDGLPQTSISAIAQTQDGYIWLATLNGLARFDGIRFKSDNTASQPALPGNRVIGLYETSESCLLIFTEFGGIAVLQDGRFKRLREERRDEDAVLFALDDRRRGVVLACRSGRLLRYDGSGLQDLSESGSTGPLLENAPGCVDKSGRVWAISASHRLLCYSNGQCECVSLAGQLTGAKCAAVIEDADGHIWLGTDQGLEIFRREGFEPVALPDGTNEAVDHILAGRDGGLWIGSGPHLRKLKGAGWIGPAFDLPSQDTEVRWFGEDASGRLCVGTVTEGLLRISPEGGVSQFGSRDGMPGNNIRCRLLDREGNEWLGLGDGGLVRLRSRRFRPLISGVGTPSAPILSVCQGDGGDGSVWLGTDGEGLACWQMGRLVRYGRAVLRSRTIASVYEDQSGILWVGALDGGLFRFQAKGFVSAVEPAMAGGSVNAIFQDTRGRLWIGSPTGLMSFEDGRFASVPGPRPSENWEVRCIEEDPGGCLWIGTGSMGLVALKDGVFKSYRRTDGLASDSIYCLCIGPNGGLWIGSEGGLSRFQESQFVNVTAADGLPDDVVYHIARDKRGFIWCSSRRGVFRIAEADVNAFEDGRVKKIPCLSFDQTDGLPSRECSGGSQPSGWTTRDGRLLIPTLKGVVVIRPDAIELNRLPPPVSIEEVSVDGELQTNAFGGNKSERTPIESGGERASSGFIEMAPGRSRLEIHYTALSFAAPQKVRFRVKLDPLEEDWEDVGTKRTVNYSYLRPGQYHFKVIACNNDGVWNEKGAELAFAVLPHLYQTWWFLSAGSLSVLAFVAGGARYATRRRLQLKLNELERQHALEKERTRIARDLHDEIGADLTQMTLLGELAKRESLSLPEVRAQVAKFTDKTRHLVRSMEEIVWAVNPRNDPLPNFSSYLCLSAQEFLRSSSIRCRLDVMPALPAVPFSVQARHNFFLAVKEAIHNVVQHSEATEMWLRIQFHDGFLAVVVKDNGKGFDSARTSGEANGLRNMRERMAEINGRMELDSAPGAGTRISFVVAANSVQIIQNHPIAG